ncbi:MAG TPA: PAS domain S-box protein, partial [Chloroflexota bacterium]
ESRYRTIVETVQEGIWMIDAMGATTFANDRLGEMFGYEPAEMLTRTVSDLMHEADQPLAIVSLAGLESANEHLDFRFQRKDGSDLWAIVSANRLLDEAGSYFGTLATLTDITARREQEEARRTSEQQLERAERVAHLGHWSLELATDALTWSDEHCRIFGRQPADGSPSHREALDQVHPEDRPILARLVARTISDGTPYEVEIRVIRPDGSLVTVESRGTREVDSDGVAIRLVGTAQDVSQRKQAGRELRSNQELLRQAQKMEAIGNLAGGIAHDFNNLLTAIIGFNEMALDEEPLTNTVRTYLEEALKSAERAATLTRQLLAFSRRQILHLEIIDINAVVTDMSRLLGRVIGEDIQLDTVLDPAKTWVRADPGQMEQVILNLAVNARDAMAAGAHLTIQTRNIELDAVRSTLYGMVRGPCVQLSVTDTGMGITKADLAQIFEPFFTTKPPGHGTGMGLATVYGIVKQSEGHVAVASEVGVGTTFDVYLPQAAADVAVKAAARAKPQLFSGNETILLVEDEPEVRKLAGTVLQRAGYTVLVAADGEAAIKAVGRHKGAIELLLTDVVMPGMNGPALAALLIKVRPAMKVLFMSGYPGDALQRQDVLQDGATYIAKPFRPRALAQKVRELLDRPHRSRRLAAPAGRASATRS